MITIPQKSSIVNLVLVASLFLSGCGTNDSTKTISLNRDDPSGTARSSGGENNIENENSGNVAESNISDTSGDQSEETSHSDKNSTLEAANGNEKENPKKDDLKIISRMVNWGYETSIGRKIDTVIIHSTYNATGGDEFDLDKIIGIYKNYGVAPHYIVARSGTIYQLASDKNIAWHAGESKMPDGRTDVNKFSIGIEVINSKTQGPTGEQYAALKKLTSDLKSKYAIKYILGHSDIAPGRKDDPWKFDWEKIK